MMPSSQPRPRAAPESHSTLIADARQGRPEALAALYHRHARDLFAVAFRLLQSTADAEDVVHDVFVGLPEALRRYEERGALAAWLKTITARVALARLRSARPSTNLEDLQVAAPEREPEARLALERAVRTLTPSLRAVLVLKEIEGFSHREIAAMLGISVGASEVRLHRALKALRARLTKGELP
jgi:RNA polymerase sigma-70 factor, ECF subfamily